MADVSPGLLEKLKRIYYDPSVGSAGSYIIPTDRDTPLTLGGVLPYLSQGVVFAPKQGLSPEDKAHEGMHSTLGLPGAMASQAFSTALNIGDERLVAPDEVAATLAQPPSPQTDYDKKTIQDMAQAIHLTKNSPLSIPRDLYLALASYLAGKR